MTMTLSMTSYDNPDALASSLAQAIESVAARTDFYRHLLDARIHVLAAHTTDGKLVPVACSNGDGSAPYVPFFSSLALLRAATAMDQKHTSIPFRELLTAIPNTMLWLNPLSTNNKQFMPDEVNFLAAKGVASAMIDSPEGGEAIQVLMSHVRSDVHKQARQFLASHLRAEEGVRSAWLIQAYRPDLDTPPSYILGIEGESLPSELLNWAVEELQHKLLPAADVALIIVETGHPYADYMKNEVTPFFVRGWMDRLFG